MTITVLDSTGATRTVKTIDDLAADGGQATLGVTTGAAVITDATGTLQQYLRGLVKLIAGGINVAITSATGLAQGSTTSGETGSLLMGAAQSAEATAVANAQTARLVTDLVGKLITLPYANPENFVNGTTAAITTTASTSLLASAGASTRNYVTDILVSNSHATVGTFVQILDGAAVLWEGWAAAAGGGFAKSFHCPLRGTAATAVNVVCVTTGANVIVSASGYEGV